MNDSFSFSIRSLWDALSNIQPLNEGLSSYTPLLFALFSLGNTLKTTVQSLISITLQNDWEHVAPTLESFFEHLKQGAQELFASFPDVENLPEFFSFLDLLSQSLRQNPHTNALVQDLSAHLQYLFEQSVQWGLELVFVKNREIEPERWLDLLERFEKLLQTIVDDVVLPNVFSSEQDSFS